MAVCTSEIARVVPSETMEVVSTVAETPKGVSEIPREVAETGSVLV